MGKVLSLLLGKKKNWSTADLVNAISKPIKLEPGVFDEEDIKWSKKGADPEAVREYLKPQDGNQATCFKVGVAFVGGADDGSLRLGHAEIVIQEYTRPAGVEKATAANPLRAADPPVVQGNGDKRMRLPEANLILIHICFPPGDQSELRLVYKEDRKALVYYRYVEMLSIYTTKRTLKHLALKACPERHSMVVSDCASVARSFIAGLFDVLGDSPALRENLKQLLKTIHVEDGWVGESEDSSRQELELSAKLERSL